MTKKNSATDSHAKTSGPFPLVNLHSAEHPGNASMQSDGTEETNRSVATCSAWFWRHGAGGSDLNRPEYVTDTVIEKTVIHMEAARLCLQFPKTNAPIATK